MPSAEPTPAANVDAQELARFERDALSFFDPDGAFGPLHVLNPVRVAWLHGLTGSLAGARVLDVGCAGGLVTSALARLGAEEVVGIDLAPGLLQMARLDALRHGLNISYLELSSTQLAAQRPASFDVVSAFELIEHVPDPEALMVDLDRLAAPGAVIALSTLNRTLRAFASAIVAAEYLTDLIPRGTHRYDRFIKPSELDRVARRLGWQRLGLSGIAYDPLRRHAQCVPRLDVNYLIAWRTVEH